MSNSKKINEWFSFSRASFLVIPRVLMEDMPAEWQSKMVELLEQYDEAFDQSKVGVEGCMVQAVDANNRFCKMPEEVKNYRRPCKMFLDRVRNET